MREGKFELETPFNIIKKKKETTIKLQASWYN